MRTDHVPPGLERLDGRLREARPRLDPDRLERVALRARRRARPAAGGTPFATRVAVVGLLVLGMVLSMGGVALSISGISGGSPTASSAQYDRPGEDEGDRGGPETLGETRAGGPAPVTREAAAPGSGELPFTGWAALPVIVVGVGMVGGGVVLRRRTRDR